MKSLLLLITIVIAPYSFGQNGKIDKRMSLYNHARNGLVLRHSASLTSEKDTLITYGEELKLIHKSDSTFTVNGFIGAWYKVEHKGHVGFVFSAYISPIKCILKEGKNVYLKDFAFENLKQTSGDPNFEMEDWLERPRSAVFGEERYQCTEGGYCDLDERLYLKQPNVQEVFIVLSAYLMDYNDYNFNASKFIYSEEERQYKHAYSAEFADGEFSKDIYLTYTLNEDGSFKSLSSSFDWEGGGGTFSVYKWSEKMICAEHTYYCH